jgi:putative ABC transport system ATP-binding protein
MTNAAPSDQPAPLFALRGICRTYGEGETAVRALIDVDLNISCGELIVLLGPSGSGKSTLLNILGGLDRPSAGAIQFRGAPLTDHDRDCLRSPNVALFKAPRKRRSPLYFNKSFKS